MVKSSSTKDILGIDIDSNRKWIEFQMTPQMNWSNIEIDHVRPIFMFDISEDEDKKEAFSWKKTQSLLEQDHHYKGTKFIFLDYQLQFIKAYQFIKSNDQARFTKIFIDEIYSESPHKNYETNKTMIKSNDDTWSSELLDMDDYCPKNNRGYRYLLTVIDKFSNFG